MLKKSMKNTNISKNFKHSKLKCLIFSIFHLNQVGLSNDRVESNSDGSVDGFAWFDFFRQADLLMYKSQLSDKASNSNDAVGVCNQYKSAD